MGWCQPLQGPTRELHQRDLSYGQSCCEPSGTQRTQRAGTVPELSERGDTAKEPQGVSRGTCWPAQHCLQGQAHWKSREAHQANNSRLKQPLMAVVPRSAGSKADAASPACLWLPIQSCSRRDAKTNLGWSQNSLKLQLCTTTLHVNQVSAAAPQNCSQLTRKLAIIML